MVKSISSSIWVDDYIIKFKYITKRNNTKEQLRLVTHIDPKLAIRDFWIWLQNYNDEKPYRSMSNVEILDIEKENGRYISL